MNTIKAALVANCEYSVLAWEPVAASGERLNVAVLYQMDGELKCKTRRIQT